ncbi:putative zinc finger cchc-type protein [Erysiphe necator]|uniref:Putative zinc finger cchc-type protein n=1 Tax=Uncinula necator TaxID=52586 RepID=A0A0B1PAM4_UNCNE|nr:putative zinc finger cchc-type protein [Erysiphe necator]
MAKKTALPGKTAGSLILWFQQAEHADRAISKGIMWRFELKATEIIRAGFRALQCFKCQRYGHIAKICTAEAKCGKCAGDHNTRECSGKREARCINCGKKHTSWYQSCPVRSAAKVKAVMNRTQDPGSYQQKETRPKNSDYDWQVVGSKKRRAGFAGPQIVGADGEIIERRGPGRPKGLTNRMPNMTIGAAMTPSIPSVPILTTPETSQTVTRESTTEASDAPLCTMTQ